MHCQIHVCILILHKPFVVCCITIYNTFPEHSVSQVQPFVQFVKVVLIHMFLISVPSMLSHILIIIIMVGVMLMDQSTLPFQQTTWNPMSMSLFMKCTTDLLSKTDTKVVDHFDFRVVFFY